MYSVCGEVELAHDTECMYSLRCRGLVPSINSYHHITTAGSTIQTMLNHIHNGNNLKDHQRTYQSLKE